MLFQCIISHLAPFVGIADFECKSDGHIALCPVIYVLNAELSMWLTASGSKLECTGPSLDRIYNKVCAHSQKTVD